MLEKRDWCYILSPSSFEVAPCSCGSTNLGWSEFKNHVWCYDCKKDFIPKHYGILDGPIPVNIASMLGIYFDRFLLPSGVIERFNTETMEYE